MSYILNALRKSEKERQALKPETATDRILIQELDQSGGSFNWKILFIVSNLVIFTTLIIAVFIWYSQKPEVKVASGTPEPSPKPSLAKVVNNPLKQPSSETAQLPQRVTKSQELQSPTIAELAAANQRAENPLPNKLPDQQESTRTRPAEQSAKEKTPTEIKKIDASVIQSKKTPSYTSEEEVTDKEKKTESASIHDDKIPFLDDLPDEFRHSVPRMTINVFVFTPQLSERFVMINMVKYKIGQQTPDGVEIKEIRDNSLVVGYHGRTFWVERP